MVVNYIVSRDNVECVSGELSSCDYFISQDDLNVLINDAECRYQFLNTLGVNKVVVTHLGQQVDPVTFKRVSKNFIDVGVNRWK